MKKTVLVVLALAAATAFAACAKKAPPAPPPPPPVAPEAPPPAPPPPPRPEVGAGGGRVRAAQGHERRGDREVGPPRRRSTSTSTRRTSASRTGPRSSKNAEALKRFDFLRVTVEGHCDERGTVEYNLALGERRAKAAYDYLVSLGVPADRLKTVSYGKEVPVCTQSTEDCWQRNRRAHFTVTGKTK